MDRTLAPSRELEKALLAELAETVENPLLAGVDEVGRGALAGPVAVGIALVDGATSDNFPSALRDSKMLSAAARESLVPLLQDWVRAYAVGYASAAEIDKWGIIAALQTAAARASADLRQQGWKFTAVLLDGSHNWWGNNSLYSPQPPELCPPNVPVKTLVKGDAKCAALAAASVLAKVQRDAFLSQLNTEHPEYDWEHNKGYSSPKHIAALQKYGVSEYHRISWKLPGIAE